MDQEKIIENFMRIGFDNNYTASNITQEEHEIIKKVLRYVDLNISQESRPKKYVLGLAIDFTLLAQRLSIIDISAKHCRLDFTEEDIFKRYTFISKRGNNTSNTLTLEYKGKNEGIRKIEEKVVDLFNSLNKTGYPSAYVYNTGQWTKYKDLLLMCFKLSEDGRYYLCKELIEYGIDLFPTHTFTGREQKKIRLFERVIQDYPRQSKGENGGLVLQSIAHGFIASDRPHLSIIADKVRTGSARQKRFGDIDCYYGLDLELSVEVKDMIIDNNNVDRQLGSFINEVTASGVLGMVICIDADNELIKKLYSRSVVMITIPYLIQVVGTWDWPKQDNALQIMLHHIAHIEQNTEATGRLLEFVASIDPNHDSLVYLSQN